MGGSLVVGDSVVVCVATVVGGSVVVLVVDVVVCVGGVVNGCVDVVAGTVSVWAVVELICGWVVDVVV